MLLIEKHFLLQCYEDGLKKYPEEACGFMTGIIGTNTLTQVLPMENQMSLYHQRDPEAYHLTNQTGYAICPKVQGKPMY